MFGALVGDCIGSFWEFSGNKDPAIPLWVPASRFTDDSVCTGAVAAALETRASFGQALHERGRGNISAGFGDRMVSWLLSDNPQPYQSWGNGSAMRVSPVALWAQTEQELLELAHLSALPTHDSPQAIRGAQATAWAIRHALENRNGPQMLEEVEARFEYDGLTSRDPVAERPDHLFDVSCQGTVPLALSIAVRSGSFDEAMRWCCSMGGDADTLAAIAGPVAEALYGIPLQHLENARQRFHPEDDIWEAVERIYQNPVVADRLARWGYPNGTSAEATDERRVSPARMRLK
jgi:ADP-ribosylglycohydrolase